MARDEHSQFDDPVLKSALQRTCGRETAPPQLRARIEQSIAARPDTAEPATPPRTAFDWRSSPLVGLAAAAMILVAIGFMYTHLRDAEPSSFTTLPNDFASDMVSAHKRAAVMPAFHQLDDVPKDDLGRIRQTLKDKLGHPVLVASLGAEWEFQGARVTQVGNQAASQLLFKKGEETISVISVSPKGRQYVPNEGANYRQTWIGHPIAGVVKGGVVHCVIGSKDSTLSERDLARLRDRITNLISAREPGGQNCGKQVPGAGAMMSSL